MHVTQDGPADAPVVLLLHGFTSSGHSWDRVVPWLATDHRVVRVDLLGHGRTGGPAADAPAQADAVAAVLRELDVHDVTAVGHSFGADVAVELAERGERVGRLVIVAQAPDYSDATLPRASVLMTRRAGPLAFRTVRPVFGALAVVARRRPVSDLPARRGELAALAAQGFTDLRAVDPEMFRVVLVQRRDRMAARPLDAQVAASGRPTAVLLGGRDGFYGDRPAARYRAVGATVEVIADSGHAVTVEHPEETARFVRAVVGGGDSPSRAPTATRHTTSSTSTPTAS